MSHTNILTDREKEVLLLIIDENSSAEIARKLHLSVRTVETHRKHIMRKTNSKTLVSIVKTAIKMGLVEGFYFNSKHKSFES